MRGLSRDPEPRFSAFQKVGLLLNPGLKMNVIKANFDPASRVDWAPISRIPAGPAVNWDCRTCALDAWR